MAPSIGQVVEFSLGTTFALIAFDSNRSWFARAGYGLVAFDLLARALGGKGDQFLGKGGAGVGSLAAVGRAAYPSLPGSTGKPLSFVEKKVRTIGERVSLCHEQMLKGVKSPEIYSRARAILSRKCDGEWCIKERDAKGEITALFADVRKNVRYTWDPTTYDAFQTPQRTLELGAGDCDDETSLLGSMLMSVGYKVRSRVVQTKGNTSWNHIYLMVQLPSDKSWMPLDPTVDKPAGWQVPEQYIIKYMDFDVVEN